MLEKIERTESGPCVSYSIATAVGFTQPEERAYILEEDGQVVIKAEDAGNNWLLMTECASTKKAKDFVNLLKNLSDVNELLLGRDRKINDIKVVTYRNGKNPTINKLEVDSVMKEEFEKANLDIFSVNDDTETYIFSPDVEEFREGYFTLKAVYDKTMESITVK